MLSVESFGRGIQLMNSVCHTQIKTNDTTNVYYMVLKDEVEDQEYIDAILDLIKHKTNVYTPFSPAEILAKIKERRKKDISLFDLIKLDIIKHGFQPDRKYKKEIQDLIDQAGGLNYICSIEDEKELKKIENLFNNINTKEIISLKNNKKVNLLK